MFDWISVQQTLAIEDAYGDSFTFFNGDITNGESEISKYSKGRTVGVIDVGGASVEFAFEVNAEDRVHKNNPFASTDGTVFIDDDDDGINSVYYNSTFYQVYARGFDIVGHHEIYYRYQDLLFKDYFVAEQTDGYVMSDPCGFNEVIVMRDFKGPFNKPAYLIGTADADLCIDILRQLLQTSESCDSDSFCSLKGVSQPFVSDNDNIFIGLNQFQDTKDYFELEDRPYIRDLYSIGVEFLATDGIDLYYEFNEDLRTAHMQCFEIFYLYTMLTDGFGFSPDSNQILFSDKFYYHHTPLTWALGAMTHEVQYYGL